MLRIYGQELGMADLVKRTGSVGQFARISKYEMADGKASGIKAIDVSNGTGLEFTVLEGKCLDIVNMKYKGMTLNFMPKTGIVAPELVDMSGTEMLRSISGGMLYTCGLLNVGSACSDEGRSQVFHGRMKITPAEHVAATGGWEGDDYVLHIAGEMREASLYGDNLLMKRQITTSIGSKSIDISDEIENQSFKEEGLMLLYHVNIGYPVLDAGSRFLAPVIATEPQTDAAKEDIRNWMTAGEPENDAGEQVFMHKLASLSGSRSAAALVNDRLGIGVFIQYDTSMLHHLFQWKSMKSGDYAFGICPSTSHIQGRSYEREHGTLIKVQPFGKIRFDIEIGVLDGANDIKSFEEYTGSGRLS